MSYARLVGPTWANLSAYSIEFWLDLSALTAGYIMRIGSATDAAVVRTSIQVGTSGQLVLVRSIGANTRTSTSPNNVLNTSTAGHVFAVFRNGNDPLLYVNAASKTLTHAGTAVTGALACVATDEYAVGDPGPTSLTGFDGTISRVVHWPMAPSEAWIAGSYRTQGDQVSIVGMSGENVAGAANRGPVAIPMFGTATENVESTFDVAARAYDPEGGTKTPSVP